MCIQLRLHFGICVIQIGYRLFEYNYSIFRFDWYYCNFEYFEYNAGMIHKSEKNMNTATKLLSAEEIALAKLGSQELSAVIETNGEAQKINVVDKSGKTHEVTIPASALNMMIEMLTQLGQGNSVSITPIHAELTTQEGADMLNMSRPTFIKLLDSQEIPFSRTGNRRKVAFADLMEYKTNLEEQRLASLAELSELDQEMGMGY